MQGRISDVTVMRTGCYGTCPFDAVSIRWDGSVWYQGWGHTLREGFHTGVLDPEAVAALFQGFLDIDFEDLPSRFEAAVDDVGTVFYNATMDGHAKTVTAQRRHAEFLDALLPMLDATLGTVHWDAQPRTLATSEDPCGRVSNALANVCEPYLTYQDASRKCPNAMWMVEALGKDSADSAQLCARMLPMIPEPAAFASVPMPSENCEIWFAGDPSSCIQALRSGATTSLAACVTAISMVEKLSEPTPISASNPDLAVCRPTGRGSFKRRRNPRPRSRAPAIVRD